MKTGLKVLALACAASLAACGGGGGGVASAPIEVTGVAAKGFVKDGLVEAFVITNGVAATTAVDSATTDKTGTYKLTKVPSGALIKLRISAVEGKTTVADEATGTDYTPTKDFTLTAVMETVAGSANEMHITQATDMVVKRAEALPGGFTATNAAFAAGEVQKSLGFAPGLKPTFAADGTPTSASAVYLKKVALVANDSTTAATLGCTSTDKATQVTCVTTAMREKIATGGDEFTKVTTALEAKKDLALAGVSDSVKSEVVAPTAVAAPKEVVVPTNLPSTAIAAGKQFILSLKSSFKTLASDVTTDVTVKSQLAKVTEEFNASTNPANNYALNAAEYLLSATSVFRDSKEASTFNDTPKVNQNGKLYTCAWFKDMTEWKKGSSSKATEAANANLLACDFDQITESTTLKTAKGSYPIRYFSGLKYIIEANSTVKDSYNAYSFAIRLVQNNTCGDTTPCWRTMYGLDTAGNVSSTPIFAQTMPALAYPSEVELASLNKATFTFTKITDTAVEANLQGFIATSMESNPAYVASSNYTKTLEWIAADKFKSKFVGTKHGISLKISASGANNKGSFSISGNHAIYKDDTTTPHSEIILDALTLNGDLDTAGELIPTDFTAGITMKSANGSFTGKLVANAFQKGPEAGSQANPTNMVLTGSIKLKTDEFFNGTITVKDLNRTTFDTSKEMSASNFSKSSIDINGKFTAPSKDPLTLLIKLDNSTYQKPSTSITYSQKDSPMITVKAFGNEAKPDEDYMDLTFGADITATIKKTDTSFELKKNGAKIATYNKSNGRVEYLDGTFEQY